jgi:hypothetical protein
MKLNVWKRIVVEEHPAATFSMEAENDWTAVVVEGGRKFIVGSFNREIVGFYQKNSRSPKSV